MSTSRPGGEVVAHYRSQLEARGWRVGVRTERYFRSQCTSGRREQAIDPERTTISFFAVTCSDITDPGERADFET